jgi:hypothetical protein
MTEVEFDKYMVNKYPEIFRERYMSIQETCMCWGFCHGPGWYGLVDLLCECLDKIHKTTQVLTVANQVKEKYGGLCFYYTIYFPEAMSNEDRKVWENIIDATVLSAERKSLSTCEKCGKYGKIRNGGWITVRCNKCQEEWENEKS